MAGGVPKPPGPRAGSAFSLAISRGGFALELTAPLPLGPLSIRELSSSLPQVRFPADVTGGLSRYRHKRGELESVAVDLPLQALGAFARERWAGLLGTAAPAVTLTATKNVVHICVAEGDGPDAPVLAFDLVFSAVDDGLVVFAETARGLHLKAPAPALALQALRALAGAHAQHAGPASKITDVPLRLSRHVFPDAGVRIPNAGGLRCVVLGTDADSLFARFLRDGAPAEVDHRAVLAQETARLLQRADDALGTRAWDDARRALLDALGTAPDHVETLRRIAEIDAHAGGRDEAALFALGRPPAGRLGPCLLQPLRGELLLRRGESELAIAALTDAGHHDPAGPLAARLFCRAAMLCAAPAQRLSLLDLAVSRDPLSPAIRRLRMTALLLRGLGDEALAESQELVAAARGPRARHAAWVSNARAFEDAGATSLAANAFEQALLYAPDSPDALGGLGRALVRTRRYARGAALLSAAIDQSDGDTSELSVLLATVLADSLGDPSLALRRLAELPPGARAQGQALQLEARLRRGLGDIAGAAVAFERLRLAGPHVPAPAEAYLDAVTFEEERGHLLEARAHALAGLDQHPQHLALQSALSRVSLALAARAPVPGDAPSPAERPKVEPSPRLAVEDRAALESATMPADSAPHALAAPPSAPASSPPDSAVDEARIEKLIERLRGDPSNDAVAEELSVLLVRTGRSMELLALLSARLEDATEEQRVRLLPKQRAVLADLAKGAEEAGRLDEAQLFRDSLEAIS